MSEPTRKRSRVGAGCGADATATSPSHPPPTSTSTSTSTSAASSSCASTSSASSSSSSALSSKGGGRGALGGSAPRRHIEVHRRDATSATDNTKEEKVGVVKAEPSLPPKSVDRVSGEGEENPGEPSIPEIVGLEEINAVQDQLEESYDKAAEAILQIEKEFNTQRKPLYEKRAALLSKTPQFWLNTLLRHDTLGPLLTEEDRQALSYCNKLTVTVNDDISSGYLIQLGFTTNPFFSNAALSKICNILPDGQSSFTGTEINWLRKQEPVKTEFEFKGLIDWFGSDNGSEEVATIIKEEIWPDPLQLYFGSPDDEHDLDEDDGDGGDADHPDDS
ncbi:protein SET [Pelomyxa schiedti]|nr:protein SET [Pelomyxa schiedti]